MRCSPFAFVILGGIGFVTPISARTQAPSAAPEVAPGQRIRVNAVGLTAPTDTTTQTGTVGWVRGDTIAFRPDGESPENSPLTAVPTGHIERLDISVGHDRHTLAGLGLGILGGAALGAGGGRPRPDAAERPFGRQRVSRLRGLAPRCRRGPRDRANCRHVDPDGAVGARVRLPGGPRVDNSASAWGRHRVPSGAQFLR
jgi:hypothetical protein